MRDLTLDVVETEVTEREHGVDGSLDDITSWTLASRSKAADCAAVGKVVMKTNRRAQLTKAKLDRRCFRGRRLSTVCRDGLTSRSGSS